MMHKRKDDNSNVIDPWPLLRRYRLTVTAIGFIFFGVVTLLVLISIVGHEDVLEAAFLELAIAAIIAGVVIL